MRILCIAAHPDDEILWLYPAFNRGHELALLTVCRNANKSDEAMLATHEVCQANGVQFLCAPLYDNQFYQLPTRFASFTLMQAVQFVHGAMERAIEEFQPDCLFTHNPWGEYGHGDHRLTFAIVSQFEMPLLLTDICLTNTCHPSTEQIPAFYRPMFQGPIEHCALDEAWYERMKAIYVRHEAWTWGGHEPVRETNLYLFDGKAV